MSEYAQALGAKLRDPDAAGAVPARRGAEVEGALEGGRRRLLRARRPRRDRAVTAQRLLELAAFYRVPVTELLPHAEQQPSASAAPPVVLDLEQLHAASPEQRTPLARYAAAIQRQRGDYNGRVLSLRAEDCGRCPRSTASPGEVAQQLLGSGVLASQRAPQHEPAQP